MRQFVLAQQAPVETHAAVQRCAWLRVLCCKPFCRWSLLHLWMSIFVVLTGNGLGFAQDAIINREHAIKAAFLYQFSNYIEWPESSFVNAEDPFVIGVFQTNPFGSKLDKIAASKKVGGRPIEIVMVASAENVRKCHILFVPATVPAEEQALAIEAAQDSHVLVVGEASNFVQSGGDVQFFLEANKIRFAFHEQVSQRRDLAISSKLLSLSKPAPQLATSAPVPR